jgi:SnoaL-like domain
MRYSLIFVLLLAGVLRESFAEDVPLMACDGLPMVQVSIGGMKFSFLLDTAATSALNLGSFSYGDAQRISVTSWNGTYSARGQKVTISDLVTGEHHLQNLRLSAVDLSAIGRACGHAVDGILGIDLLGTLGAVVDLKGHVARLPADPEIAQSRVAELDKRLALCAQAFNSGEEQVFLDCLDPRVVLFMAIGDFYSREAFMEYLRRERSRQRALPQLVITLRAHHLLGQEIWAEVELRIKLEQQVVRTRGTMLCEKFGPVWRIVHLNSSPSFADVLALGGH